MKQQVKVIGNRVRWTSHTGTKYWHDETSIEHCACIFRMLWNYVLVPRGVKSLVIPGGNNWDLAHVDEKVAQKALQILKSYIYDNGNAICKNQRVLYKSIVELEIDEEAEEKIPEVFMKKVNFVSVKIITAHMPGQPLQYMTVDTSLAVDDKVVVELLDGFAIAVVVSINDTTKIAKKWVIQKLDFTAVNAVKADIAEAQRIRKELDKRLEAQRARIVYEQLAREDPEAADLLAELERLEG